MNVHATVNQSKLAGTVWKGERVSKGGVYANIPIARYHAKDVCETVSISSSGLRTLLLESPAHYWCRSPLNPKRVEEPTARHFVVGRAMHHLMFGEAHFAQNFIWTPAKTHDAKYNTVDWSLRFDAAKAWKADREAEGLEIIKPDEQEMIRGMTEALMANSFVAKHGIFNGYIERSAFHRDEETGVWLKVRPDVIPGDSGDFIDFKTTTSVQKPDLMRTIEENGYAMQFALMREVFGKLKIPFHSATLVFVEKKPPHCVRVLTLEPKELDLGERQNRVALRTFVRCLKAKEWPGPGGTSSDAEPIHLSDRYREAAERQLNYGA